MSIHFSLGNRLVRAAVSLGFFGCLAATETISSQAATSESSVATREATPAAYIGMPNFSGSRCTNPNNGSDLILTIQVEISLPDEYGVAFEDDDSIEMLRVNIQQRTLRIDRIGIGQKFASRSAQDMRPNISPPLLV